MAQIPKQVEVSLEVALPTRARLCARPKSDSLCGVVKGSKGSPVCQLNGRNCPCGRQSPDSLELLEKKNLKPEQVENRKEVLVMKVVPEREVPSRWAEWSGLHEPLLTLMAHWAALVQSGSRLRRAGVLPSRHAWLLWAHQAAWGLPRRVLAVGFLG